MGTIFVDNLEPQSGTSLTLGASGDSISLASGATQSGFGKIGQVLSANHATAVTSTTSTYADTGLTLSITPSSTSSKILVTVSQNLVIYDTIGNSAIGKVKVVRDSTDLDEMRGIAGRYPATDFSWSTTGIQSLDSPSSTSSLTYKTQFACDAGSQVRVQYDGISPSYITLMEILA